MKHTLIPALTIFVAAVTITPTVSANQPGSSNLQEQRLETLDQHTKTTTYQTIQVEYLNVYSKANDPIEDIQEARLNSMDERTKSVVR